jgi:hypothetical protein
MLVTESSTPIDSLFLKKRGETWDLLFDSREFCIDPLFLEEMVNCGISFSHLKRGRIMVQ